MKLTNHSDVPVYTISGTSTARPLPEWLARKRKRSLKHDPEYASRIELLQDFEFEEASQCIRISDDGQWVMSTGMRFALLQCCLHSTSTLPFIVLIVLSRDIQTSNSYSLLASPFLVVRKTYYLTQYNVPPPLLRLLQVYPPPSRSLYRVPHASGMSLQHTHTSIRS